uniref:Glutamine amidotransferase type-2 domain-containing protein n=1 Tax=Ananas comosus var. bracteatus TaxID=296719 RepID=A0A6V7QFK1_ANACO|nr:unnamed protein product [Ananas comosus var. bracteatus]
MGPAETRHYLSESLTDNVVYRSAEPEIRIRRTRGATGTVYSAESTKLAGPTHSDGVDRAADAATRGSGAASEPLGLEGKRVEASRSGLGWFAPVWRLFSVAPKTRDHRSCIRDQPLFNEDKTIVVTVNGEIYNHEELRNKLSNHKFRTGSDCEVIAHLYEEYGDEFVDMLDGVFSFVLLDMRDNSFIVARDAIGITPLYIGWGLDGSVWISSEMKGLNDDCEHFEVFPPGHVYSSKKGGYKRWYNPPWYAEAIPSVPYDPLVLRKAFESAVIKRLLTDVPFGVLLSGGLDSSLVAAVTARHFAGTKAAEHWGGQLRSFCIGLEGSPDLKAAKEVADYLGTVHHEFHFSVQDGIDAIEDVIYHIETYDVTTIRASTPMFLMARKIKSLGVKMVISGEGSDEIFGGYLYFHKAPDKKEFHEETCRKIKALHQYDCLRANKATSAWG